MADSKYKLTYFTIRGLAEGIRFIFAYAGVEYEDNRIAQDDWSALKSSFEFGKLPILEVDGQIINQSASIARFLGKRFGLVNEDPVKDALLEALVDNLKDVIAKLKGAMTPGNTEGKKEFDELLEGFLKIYENKAPEGYFYGSKVTWVDLFFAGSIDIMQTYIGPVLKPYPKLTALTERIRNQEKLKKWIEVRPGDTWKFPEGK